MKVGILDLFWVVVISDYFFFYYVNMVRLNDGVRKVLFLWN